MAISDERFPSAPERLRRDLDILARLVSVLACSDVLQEALVTNSALQLHSFGHPGGLAFISFFGHQLTVSGVTCHPPTSCQFPSRTGRRARRCRRLW